MSLSVYVTYEPDGSPPAPARGDRRLNLMISRLQTGAELCQEVHKRIRDGELRKPVEEYMLYWPERKLWLPSAKSVGHLHIESGAKLEYRPRKRRIKLRFLDASSKLLVADETKPVKKLVEDLCEQLQIIHPEELSLVVAGDYAVQKHHPAKNKSLSMTRVGSGSPTEGRKVSSAKKERLGADTTSQPISPSLRRKRPGSASSKKHPNWTTSKVKKQISKKHQIRLDTPWLDPTKTLAEQEVTESDELILMYRFYYHMQLQRNSANVEMLYKQARATYLAGELLCSPNDMVRLSAILCQIMKGDYSKQKYNPDFISSIKEFIAPPKCKIKTIAKQITTQHSSLEGLSIADAKCWFVKLWSSLELFGMEFLSSTNTDTKDKGLVGVSKDKIMFLYHKKKTNTFWDIDKLVQWTHDPGSDTVSLTFSYEKSTEVLNLKLPEYSGVLVDCLQGHREVGDTIPDIMRACTEYQFDEEMESAISMFATLTKRDAKVRRALTTLTYEDVYWASKIENPMLSDEELKQMKSSSWENPVFSNMDQLMDERFSFLDFSEYSAPEQEDDLKAARTKRATLQPSPTHSPYHLHSSPHHKDSSPLIVSRKSVEVHLSNTAGYEIVDGKETAGHRGGGGGVGSLATGPISKQHSRKLSSSSGSSSSVGEGGGSGSMDEEENKVLAGHSQD